MRGHRSWSDPNGDSLHGLAAGAGRIAVCAAAGVAVAGPAGAAVGGVLGLSLLFPMAMTDSARRIGERVEGAALEATRNPGPSSSWARRAAWLVTRGGLAGLARGAGEGYGRGAALGKALASGIAEGAKGFAGEALRRIEEPEVPETSRGVLAVLRVPRALLGLSAGLVGGLAEMVLETPDGVLQGARMGLSDGTPPAPVGPFEETPEGRLHAVARAASAVAAGAGVGLALGGPGGAIAGVMAGAVLEAVHMIAESWAGRDREMVAGIQAAVGRAESDNRYSGSGAPLARPGPRRSRGRRTP